LPAWDQTEEIARVAPRLDVVHPATREERCERRIAIGAIFAAHGLDEATGDLIFVGTSRDEVSFVHQDLEGHTEYFCRVFVLNEFGQLGGSNTVSKTTSAKNLVVDGGFESGALDAWDVRSGNVRVESEHVHDGQYSVYLNNAEREICCPNVLVTSTYPISLVAEEHYELSAWIKAEGVNNGMGTAWIDVITGNDNYVAGLDFGHETNVTIPGPIDTIDWQYHSSIFVAEQRHERDPNPFAVLGRLDRRAHAARPVSARE